MDVNGTRHLYFANMLNQYTNRFVPGVIDVMGEANVDSVVTVNDSLTVCEGKYWHGRVIVDNTITRKHGVNIVGVLRNAGDVGKDIVREIKGGKVIPKANQEFSLDMI